jgi:hypothetical protein
VNEPKTKGKTMNNENENPFVPSSYGWHKAVIKETREILSKNNTLRLLIIKAEIASGESYIATIPLVEGGKLARKKESLMDALGITDESGASSLIGRPVKINVAPWANNGRFGEEIVDFAELEEVPF